MTEPKVYDAKGNRLEVGRRVGSNRGEGTVSSISDYPVWVRIRRENVHSVAFQARWAGEVGTYRCNDLQLIKDTKEEA